MTPKEIKDFCLKNKQKGLIELTQKFDNINLEIFALNVPKNLEIDLFLAESIKIAKENIEKFHEAEYKKLQAFENDKIETSKGITCWKKFTPIENVGVYVPNRLFSSALMNIIPAQIAGCKNIVICTPPKPSNELLWTLNLLGIEKIYCIGGAQAIFAMAYGIGEIPKVDKIFGPGNEFVDEAKRLIASEVAIDMPAGPSEVLIIADEFANKNAVIFDILAQLEHGRKSRAWLFALDEKIAEYVKENITKIAFNSINSGV
jgi:histidinol dehydrogenase